MATPFDTDWSFSAIEAGPDAYLLSGTSDTPSKNTVTADPTPETPIALSNDTTLSRKPVTMLDLPEELFDIICSYAFGETHIYLDINRHTPTRFKYSFPKSFSDIEGMRSTNRLIRERGLACVTREGRFSANTDNFSNLPSAFGQANAALIANLKLQCFWPAKMLDEQEWPALHQMLRQYLPNLEYLELWSTHNNIPYPAHETGPAYAGISRQQQEFCGLIKNASFLQHPNLTRIIYTADSGPTFETGETKVTNRVVLISEKKGWKWGMRRAWTDLTRTEPKVLIKDRVINATLVRQTRKTVMPTLPIEHFFVQPQSGQNNNNIITSEIPAQVGIYKILEERAYKSRDHHTTNEWDWRGNDDLIDFCEELDKVGALDSSDPGMAQALSRSLDALAIDDRRLGEVIRERDRLNIEVAERVEQLVEADLAIGRHQSRHNELQHLLEESVRDYDVLSGDLRDLEEDYKDLKSDLAFYKAESIGSMFDAAQAEYERAEECRGTQKA